MARKNGVDPGDVRRLKGRGRGFQQQLTREVNRALRRQRDAWFGAMAQRFRAPLTVYGQPNPNRTLHNRTNALRNSLKGRVFGTSLKKMGIHYFSSHPGAALQEYGGVVRPRNAKFLTIPIDDNLFPAGGRRRKSPRDFPDGFFLRLQGGRLYFVRKTQDDLEFLFALRKSVKIPGPRTGRESRLKFTENAVGKQARKDLRRRLAEGSRRAIRATYGGSSGVLAGPRGTLPG